MVEGRGGEVAEVEGCHDVCVDVSRNLKRVRRYSAKFTKSY